MAVPLLPPAADQGPPVIGRPGAPRLCVLDTVNGVRCSSHLHELRPDVLYVSLADRSGFLAGFMINPFMQAIVTDHIYASELYSAGFYYVLTNQAVKDSDSRTSAHAITAEFCFLTYRAAEPKTADEFGEMTMPDGEREE